MTLKYELIGSDLMNICRHSDAFSIELLNNEPLQSITNINSKLVSFVKIGKLGEIVNAQELF